METIITIVSVYALIILVLTTSVFLVAQLIRDNSILDICYGPLFALAAWGTVLMTETPLTPAVLAVLAMVSVWAARLAIRIGRKNIGQPEDARYAAWRDVWTKKGTLYFIVRSYLQINLLQGVIIVIVALPIQFVIAYQVVPVWWLVVGIAISLGGLLYETIADWQLDRFIQGKRAGTESATLMRSGLFALSRRPNYFGESLVWWGLGVVALTLPYGYLALLGPALITYVVTRITGPMLEKQFLEKYPSEYQDYIETTNYFIPGPKKA